ncbi:hypothetical protein ILUMI_14276 [Ignelater luminosus]|uniref:PiggyBac transposable element-derived protein domain-containing protein n=1 Tax=Ignelater luminosus TaxID=2038154 RepID=A0A8K0G7X0_IGNLU|nr:hypothetical protein ILUMI_14276 [Ignelater luminosus]
MRSLWATKGRGRPISRATMSLARFSFLLACLRFDDLDTRIERSKTNKLAAISEIFQKFVENCNACCCPGAYVTVDEMLIPFRGRCFFKMYMPNKPAKYGIKVQILADAKTHSPIIGTNRNITADNWYSSVKLVEELRKHNITYVGTLKKHKRPIRLEFLPNRNRSGKLPLFGFTSTTILVSFVPKKGRSVILLSSMHHDASVNKDNQKLEIIHLYNDTKSGVDSLDAKCALYSVQRRSRRWPMAVFFAVLNIAGVNDYTIAIVVLYQCSANAQGIRRFKYIEELGFQLPEPLLRKRIENKKVPMKLRVLAAEILEIPLPDTQTSVEGNCSRINN